MFHNQVAIDTATGQTLSIQKLDVPALHGPVGEAEARAAGRLYWEFLRRFGRGLLRVVEQPGGGVAIYGLGLVLLLAFEPPQVVCAAGDGGVTSAGRVALRYPVGHGAAVRPGRQGQGYLQMGVAPGQVSLSVEGYFPSLGAPGGPGRWLYGRTQSALHVAIARGYLSELARLLLHRA